jgi:hypothetical protein
MTDRLMGVAALVAMCGTAAARQATDPPAADAAAPVAAEDSGAWVVQLEPMLWYPALRGEMAVSGGQRLDVGAFDLDENEATPAGELTIRSGDDAGSWWFVFSGFSFETDGGRVMNGLVDIGGPLVEAGDRLDFDLRFTSVEGFVEYSLPSIIDEGDVHWWINLCGGARLYDVSLDSEVNGDPATSDDNTWFEPVGGVRMMLELPHGFGFELAANAGGFVNGDDSSLSWSISAAFLWNFCPNAAVEIGFRHLSVDLEDGEDDPFVFDNALAGLWGSVVIRF